MKNYCNLSKASDIKFSEKGQKFGFLLHIYVHIGRKRLLSLFLYLCVQNEKILYFLQFCHTEMRIVTLTRIIQSVIIRKS